MKTRVYTKHGVIIFTGGVEIERMSNGTTVILSHPYAGNKAYATVHDPADIVRISVNEFSFER